MSGRTSMEKMEKNDAIGETTFIKTDSDLDITKEAPKGFKTTPVVAGRLVGSAGGRIIPGPTWVYGTTAPNRTISSSGSGLLLANKGHIALASPEVIQNYLYPISPLLQHKILKYRNELSELLTLELNSSSVKLFENPLLVIVGPCFIKSSNQVKACSQWVGSLLGKKFTKTPTTDQLVPENVVDIYNSPQKPKNLKLALRTNLTNYNLPYADFDQIKQDSNASIMTYEVVQGMPFCRALLDEMSEICPIVGETSDTITPQYLSDLFCLGLVSSTLVESQLHRELVSGVSYPVGFSTSDSHLPFDKSMYKHRVQSALDAMYASQQEHQFLSVNKLGMVTVVGTAGNDETFIILQLNLQASFGFEELKEIVRIVYDHPKLQFTTPKVMLDIGKVSNTDYNAKLTLLQQFLSEEDQNLKYKIVGVLIDSGDDYVPGNYKVDLDQNHEALSFRAESRAESGRASNNSLHRNFEQMNRYFERSRISSVEVSDDTSTEENYYEYFINANKLIAELDHMSYRRKTN